MEESRDPEESALYAYGVIEREDVELTVDGVDGAEVAYTVDHPPLSAVVTDVDTVEPDRTEENTRAHNEVLQEVLEYDGGRAVVPMQFGMAFRNRDVLENLLERAEPAFTTALEEVDGRVELGLKVLTPPDATGDVDEAAVRAAVAERFDDLAVATSRGDRFSDLLVVNRSFLVERDDREAFDRGVGAFQEAHGELLVQYTGPWPPYSFVEIEIGAQQ